MGVNLLSSLDFTSSPPWWFFTGTFPTGQTDPDGGTKACKVIPDNTLNNHNFFQDVGSLPNVARRVCLEMVAKPAGFNCFWMYLTDGGLNYWGTAFDVSAGTTSGANGNGSAVFLDSSIKPYPNGSGWYTCRLMVSLPASTTCSVLIRSADNSNVDYMTGNGVDGVFMSFPIASEMTNTTIPRPFNINLLR